MSDNDFQTKQEVIDLIKECKHCNRKMNLRNLKIYWGSWLSPGGYIVDKHFQHCCGNVIYTSSQLL